MRNENKTNVTPVVSLVVCVDTIYFSPVCRNLKWRRQNAIKLFHCENVWVTLCLWSKLSKLKLNQATSCSKQTNNDLRHPDFIVLRLHSSYRHRVGCRGDTRTPWGLWKLVEKLSPDSWAGSTLNLVITSRMWRAAVMGAWEFHRLAAPSVINCRESDGADNL